MKKISLILLATVSLLAGSCVSTDSAPPECPYQNVNIIAPASEQTAVEQYLASAAITGTTKHPSGFFYKISTEGTGDRPGLCSQIGILYKGQLVNGTVFDQTTNNNMAVFVLGRLIQGWQKGIPLVKQGGKITLYIPPSLGYGNRDVKDNQGNIIIPANSILIFEVDLRLVVV